MFRFRYFARNINAGSLLEIFLVSAISSILLIRFFLEITGYPSIGGSQYHIAHMLWGGLLMLVAMIVSLAFINREASQLAAFVGGLGFGAFIDELGKFITRDNNYFFEPTIALIYCLFVLIFIFTRVIRARRKYTEQEYIINSLEMVKEAIVNDLDHEEKTTSLSYLRRCDQKDPLVKALTHFIKQIENVRSVKPDVFSRLRSFLRLTYHTVVQQPYFTTSVITFFIVQSLFNNLKSIFFVKGIDGVVFSSLLIAMLLVGFINHIITGISKLHALVYMITLVVVAVLLYGSLVTIDQPRLNFTQWAEIIFPAISGILVIKGVLTMRSSRLQAYRLFRQSVLVTIFLSQVFYFYSNQLSAMVGLIGNLIILLVLRYMINQERAMLRSKKSYGPDLISQIFSLEALRRLVFLKN